MSQPEMPKNYDFSTVEPRWIARWEELGIYRHDRNSAAAKAGSIYSVDTPPPYVSSAHLHVGHAMSYSQAEFVVRFKRMRGYEIYYPMGFDDNGLPTERYVEKKYKTGKGRISRDEFVALCLKETRAGAKVYEELWRSLGLSVDWRMTYSTIQPRAVNNSQRSFIELQRAGHIERRADPILWCPRCATALAQADVEAGEETSRPMHRVRFERDDGGPAGLIETTRPELITACVAIAANPKDPRFAGLDGVQFRVPLSERRADGSVGAFALAPLIYDEGVDQEFGTGLMMVCTFGDPEDIAKWRTHRLDTRMVINAEGRMTTPELPELHGLRVHVLAKGSRQSEARAKAIELLEQHGYLLAVEDNVSRAAVHERCDTPVEIQVAPQWFIKVLDLKAPLLARGRELRWYPEFMRERYEAWVEGLRWDWNISRQRFYGVPFPVWYCESCDGSVLPDVADLPIDPLVDPSPVKCCPSCGHDKLRPEEDVMDTWMTSSLTPLINANWAAWDQTAPESADIALQARSEIYPMGVRVQAFEIIRTWLFYTVVKSHLHTDSLPWRDVMISGWGLDRHGKKMSKRAGNFVDPKDVIRRYSADSLRYWSAGATLGNDLRYHEEDVKGGKRLLTKLWNSTRFAMQNIGDTWRPGRAEETPTPADRWIRSRIIAAVERATAAFEQYEYNKALRAVEGLFWREWCDNYLEMIKDRFRNPDDYPAGEIEAARRTIFFGTWTLLRLFAPMLPFISEELYELAIRPRLDADAPRSIHVAPWPKSEAGGAVDVFGGGADVEGERLGDLLVELVGAVRQLKTQGQLGMGRPLHGIYMVAEGAIRADIEAVASDLCATARAATVVWHAPPEGAHELAAPTHSVEGRAILIGIDPAPRPVRS